MACGARVGTAESKKKKRTKDEKKTTTTTTKKWVEMKKKRKIKKKKMMKALSRTTGVRVPAVFIGRKRRTPVADGNVSF